MLTSRTLNRVVNKKCEALDKSGIAIFRLNLSESRRGVFQRYLSLEKALTDL